MVARLKPLLIGLEPGRGNGEPLSGLCGRRLAALCGLSLDSYLGSFSRINARGCPDIHSRIAARTVVVVLGRVAARIVGLPTSLPFLAWVDVYRDNGTWIAVSPHPSGRNRWWNDPDNRLRAGVFWRGVTHGRVRA